MPAIVTINASSNSIRLGGLTSPIQQLSLQHVQWLNIDITQTNRLMTPRIALHQVLIIFNIEYRFDVFWSWSRKRSPNGRNAGSTKRWS